MYQILCQMIIKLANDTYFLEALVEEEKLSLKFNKAKIAFMPSIQCVFTLFIWLKRIIFEVL